MTLMAAALRLSHTRICSGQGAVAEESEANGVEAGAAKKKKKKDKKKGEAGEPQAPQEVPAAPEAPPQESNAQDAPLIDPAEVCQELFLASCYPQELRQRLTMSLSDQAKKLLAKKKATQCKKSSSSSASLAAKEAKERAAKKSKVKDKKNYNQVRGPAVLDLCKLDALHTVSVSMTALHILVAGTDALRETCRVSSAL